MNIITNSKYDYVGVFFDSGKPSFRADINPSYKAHRAPTEQVRNILIRLVELILTYYFIGFKDTISNCYKSNRANGITCDCATRI
jgi:5'-3' exonuclease